MELNRGDESAKVGEKKPSNVISVRKARINKQVNQINFPDEFARSHFSFYTFLVNFLNFIALKEFLLQS